MRPEAYLYPSLRSFLLLDGEWFVIKDPKNEGIRRKWYCKENFQQIDTLKVDVPSCWQTYGDDFVDHTGIVWYFKHFSWLLEKNDSGIFLLDFTAIDFRADIWLNGKKVGKHEGGYTRFTIDVTDHINDGENFLVVRVCDPKDVTKIPHGKQGKPWYARISGIWGSVYIEYIQSKIFLDDIYIKPKDSLDAISVMFDLSCKQVEPLLLDLSKYSIKVEITSNNEIKISYSESLEKLRSSLEQNNFEVSNISIPNPEHWSVENPHLYVCRIYLIDSPNNTFVDVVDVEFGLRTVNQKDGLVYLNHQPILLKGVLDQAFHPLTLYNYPKEKGNNDEFIKKEILLLKDLGFNIIRKHIKIEDPRYLYWCDHLGLLYWEEMPNFDILCRRSKKIFNYELESMILRDRNHPCIIIWGIFNENWGVPLLWFNLHNRFIKKLYNRVKSLDNTRLVIDNSGWAHHTQTTDINDYHCYYLAPESSKLWTEIAEFILNNPTTNFRGGKQELMFNLPVILSEFGHAGLPDIKKLEHSNTLNYLGIPEYFRRGVEYPIIGSLKVEGWEERYNKFANEFFLQPLEFNIIVKLDQFKSWYSNKFVIEELRRLRGKNGSRWVGYIITEFTDVEWEYNGILDYHRRPKLFTELFKVLNSDILTIVRSNKRVYSAEDVLELEISIDNFSRFAGETELTIVFKMGEKSLIEKKRDILLKPFSLTKIKENYSLSEILKPFEPSELEFCKVSVELSYRGEIINYNSEPIFIVNQELTPKNQLSDVVITKSWKEAKNTAITGKNAILIFDPKSLVISSQKRKYWNLRALIKIAVDLLFKRKKIKELGLTFVPHHLGENWIGMFSLHLFFPRFLKFKEIVSYFWALEGLFPSYKIQISEKIRTTFSFKILSGVLQGWFNKFYATTLHFKYVNGSIVVTTLPISNNDNLIANVIVSRIIKFLQE